VYPGCASLLSKQGDNLILLEAGHDGGDPVWFAFADGAFLPSRSIRGAAQPFIEVGLAGVLAAATFIAASRGFVGRVWQ